MMNAARLAWLITAAGLAGCATFELPPDYVPDERVVFLKQRTDLGPVRYEPEAADPYVFKADPPHRGDTDAFLATRWNALLEVDFQADARVYHEAAAYFGRAMDLTAFKELRGRLDSAAISAPPPLPRITGEKRRDYTNGAAFTYPGAAGATITVLDNGEYQIDFADKSTFRYWRGGRYERTDAAGRIVYRFDPGAPASFAAIDGYTLTSKGAYRSVSGPEGTLEYDVDPVPQYRLSRVGAAPSREHVYFVRDGRIGSVSTQVRGGLRFDWFPESSDLMISSGSECLVIDAGLRKRHARLEAGTTSEGDILSLYLPEGIRLADLHPPRLAHAVVRPAWPENYLRKAVGPFDVLYTARDEALVGRLDPSRLTDMEAKCRALTGLAAAEDRIVLIPPDLSTYRKLHATRPGEVLAWDPSGFASRGLIVMWPLSVPRYRSPQGEAWFFGIELYEILAHEYVHVLVSENTGLRSPVPVWLTEGLAVHVECALSPEARQYWDVTFSVSRSLRRLLDWDDATVTPTGVRPVAEARVHYAQSRALVAVLVDRFGPAKVAEYVRAFRVPVREAPLVDLKKAWQARFRDVFGVEWSEAAKALETVE